jgi:hypothetical protein
MVDTATLSRDATGRVTAVLTNDVPTATLTRGPIAGGVSARLSVGPIGE